MPPKKQTQTQTQTKITKTIKPVKPKAASASAAAGTKLPKRRNWDREREVLRRFDLNINYGPIIGISRQDRLARAEHFGILTADDEEVKQILKDPALPLELSLNIWHDLESII